jgi:hypothetical protein
LSEDRKLWKLTHHTNLIQKAMPNIKLAGKVKR